MERRVFCAMGGGGSTFLFQCLSKRYEVLSKPDTIFSPDNAVLGEFETSGERLKHLLSRAPSAASLHDLQFEEFFPNLLEIVSKRPQHALILNTAFELGALSDNNVKDVVFLVRHPRDAYLSFCKRERHYAFSKALGGPFAKQSIVAYTNRWNSLVDEYLKCLEKSLSPKLVRYERFKADIRCAAPTLDSEDFVAGKKNYWGADGDHVTFFNRQIKHNLDRLRHTQY